MHFKIYVDSETREKDSWFGDCSWSYVIEGDSSSLNGPSSLSGMLENNTINRALLVATIEALKVLPPDCEIHVTSRHDYLKRNINFGLLSWRKSGWKTKATRGRSSQEVKHVDLWKEIDELLTNVLSMNGKSFRRTPHVSKPIVSKKQSDGFYTPGLNSFRKKTRRPWPHVLRGLALGRCQAMLSLPAEMTGEDKDSLRKLLLKLTERIEVEFESGNKLTSARR